MPAVKGAVFFGSDGAAMHLLTFADGCDRTIIADCGSRLPVTVVAHPRRMVRLENVTFSCVYCEQRRLSLLAPDYSCGNGDDVVPW